MLHYNRLKKELERCMKKPGVSAIKMRPEMYYRINNKTSELLSLYNNWMRTSRPGLFGLRHRKIDASIKELNAVMELSALGEKVFSVNSSVASQVANEIEDRLYELDNALPSGARNVLDASQDEKSKGNEEEKTDENKERLASKPNKGKGKKENKEMETEEEEYGGPQM